MEEARDLREAAEEILVSPTYAPHLFLCGRPVVGAQDEAVAAVVSHAPDPVEPFSAPSNLVGRQALVMKDRVVETLNALREAEAGRPSRRGGTADLAKAQAASTAAETLALIHKALSSIDACLRRQDLAGATDRLDELSVLEREFVGTTPEAERAVRAIKQAVAAKRAATTHAVVTQWINTLVVATAEGARAVLDSTRGHGLDDEAIHELLDDEAIHELLDDEAIHELLDPLASNVLAVAHVHPSTTTDPGQLLERLSPPAAAAAVRATADALATNILAPALAGTAVLVPIKLPPTKRARGEALVAVVRGGDKSIASIALALRYLFAPMLAASPGGTTKKLLHRLWWGAALDRLELSSTYLGSHTPQQGGLAVALLATSANSTVVEGLEEWVQSQGIDTKGLLKETFADLPRHEAIDQRRRIIAKARHICMTQFGTTVTIDEESCDTTITSIKGRHKANNPGGAAHDHTPTTDASIVRITPQGRWAPDGWPTSTAEHSFFRLERVQVSKAATDIATLAKETLQQASHNPNGHILVQAARETLAVYRAIIPATTTTADPRTAAIVHNDAIFLAHQAAILGQTADTRTADQIPHLRELAEQVIVQQLKTQRNAIRATIKTQRLALMETPVQQAMDHIQHLKDTWEPVLPESTTKACIDHLTDTLLQAIIASVKEGAPELNRAQASAAAHALEAVAPPPDIPHAAEAQALAKRLRNTSMQVDTP
jgi:hypothetical protein